MRFPPALYQIERTLSHQLPTLRPAQQRGLALWVYGTILAQSACQTAVIVALLTFGSYFAARQRLRKWLSMMVPTKLRPVTRKSLSTHQTQQVAISGINPVPCSALRLTCYETCAGVRMALASSFSRSLLCAAELPAFDAGRSADTGAGIAAYAGVRW